MSLKNAQEKGAPSNLDSHNNIRCEAYDKTPAPRVQTVSILMQKATNNLAIMLDALGEVSELSLAIQSESTIGLLNKANKRVKRRTISSFSAVQWTRRGTTAYESCAAGVHREVMLSSHSKV